MKKKFLAILVCMLVAIGSAFNVVTSTGVSEKRLFNQSINSKQEGNTLITELGNNRVIEVNSNGTIVWQKTGLNTPVDAERLPNGNTLITELGNNRVIEVDTGGDIVWEYTGGLNTPFDAERLANGNTLITDAYNFRVIEVTSNGTIVWEKNSSAQISDAERLANGNTLIAEWFDNIIIEVDSSGEVVWEFTVDVPIDVERLANGNTLITQYYYYDYNLVLEVDSGGNTIWLYNTSASVYDAERLANGNTLIADLEHNSVIEVDSSGTIVWQKTGLNTPVDVERLAIGNTPPDPILIGPNKGVTTIPYLFYIRAPDEQEDNVYYRFDWDDGEGWTSWDGPYNHQTWIEYEYTWMTSGDKTIRYQARDDTIESDIREFEIEIKDYDGTTEDPYVDVYLDYDPSILLARGLTKPERDELKPGNTVKYSIRINNNGTKDADNVKVDFILLDKYPIPSVWVDVPKRGSKMVTTTWTIPGLTPSEQWIINRTGIRIEVYHPLDVDITPYNIAFDNFNVQWVSMDPAVTRTVYIYNKYSVSIDVEIDVENTVPDPSHKIWGISVYPKQLTIAPFGIGQVTLAVTPPQNIELGDKIEVVVSARRVAKETRDKGELIQSESVRVIDDENPPTLNVNKPIEGLYLLNQKILPLLPFKIIPFIRAILFGAITIKGDAYDFERNGEIDKVVVYIDDEPIDTSYDNIFSYTWKDVIYFQSHRITVEVLDKAGRKDSFQLNVFKII